MIIATTTLTLVEQCTNNDLLENETMTQGTPETPREAEVEAIAITPPAPPVQSRYTSKNSNLIPYNKKAFELKKMAPFDLKKTIQVLIQPSIVL